MVSHTSNYKDLVLRETSAADYVGASCRVQPEAEKCIGQLLLGRSIFSPRDLD